MTPLPTLIAELEEAAAAWHKSLYREDMAEPFALLCYAYLPTLIEAVKQQGEIIALWEQFFDAHIAHDPMFFKPEIGALLKEIGHHRAALKEPTDV